MGAIARSVLRWFIFSRCDVVRFPHHVAKKRRKAKERQVGHKVMTRNILINHRGARGKQSAHWVELTKASKFGVEEASRGWPLGRGAQLESVAGI